MGTYIPLLRDYELQLFKKFKPQILSRKTPIIAIGGFSGTGKDTVARFVHEFFLKQHAMDLKITGAGEFVRKIAIESGWEEKRLDEFMNHIKETQDKQFAEKVDIEIEKHALKTALLEGGIFVGRMAPFAIGQNGLTIWLEVAAKVIAYRISHDPTRAEFNMDQEELVKRIKHRDKTDGTRLERIYKISFRDKKNFDLTLRNEGYSFLELRKKIEDLLTIKFPPNPLI
ncbi:MAG: hypothetical protein EAX86_02545 [Candidatus Heimdallarchaeota archaeon]|nr:hypothetical protein [Candidatus Heimdallarchaeota archaeon]